MSTIKRCLEGSKFDTRLIDINLKSAFITEDQVQNHLAQLQTGEENYTEIRIEGDRGEDQVEASVQADAVVETNSSDSEGYNPVY